MNPEIIGFLAGILTTVAYIPQTIRVARTKHTTSLSVYMYVLISSGIAFWCVYGIMLESPSLVIANAVSLFMTLYILFMKLRHG